MVKALVTDVMYTKWNTGCQSTIIAYPLQCTSLNLVVNYTTKPRVEVSALFLQMERVFAYVSSPKPYWEFLDSHVPNTTVKS